jgi:DNA-binding NtrC family response regulator
MKSDIHLLVVSKDSSLFETLKNSSLADNFALHFCRMDEDILSILKDFAIKVVFLDLDDSAQENLNLLQKLKEFDPLLDVIAVGEPQNSEKVMDWIHKGATNYLAKPIQIQNIQADLDKIIEKKALRRETFLLEKKLEKKYMFQGMISKNPFMLENFSLIENIAKYYTSALITGETGTGKEMVAWAIHNLSPVKNRKPVICDCASIPESLFESELFGYMRGAFTGADRNKRGLFEEANGGTIFLDEIAEIPISIQAKLLRILEHHEFRPLGSNESKFIEVKVIAATNRNLTESIQKNSFREDLFHRLNKVEIHLPPLRERLEDIPLLVRYFLSCYNKKFFKELRGVSREVQKLFLKYDWPGNIRELENVLERASMLCQKGFIDIENLPKYLRDAVPGPSRIPFISKENLSTLDNLEKDYIAYLLKITNKNLKKTAQILGISRTTLYHKLEKYNLSH